MLEELDERLLQEWIAYHNLEPFGQDRGDVGHAVVAASVMNVFRGKRRAVRPASLLPFISDRKREAPTSQAIREKVGAIKGLWNRVVEKKRKQ